MQERFREYLKKEIMLTIEIKICRTWVDKKNRIYEKSLSLGKKMLHYLINSIEELENVC